MGKSELKLVRMLRSIIPMWIRQRIQANPKLHGIARYCTALLLKTGGKIQAIQYGSASGVNLVIGEHITEVYLSGLYEPDVQAALVAHLRPGDVMYDIGASIGFFSLLGGKIVGQKGRVYSFEPAPHAFKILLEQINANNFNWVMPFQQCLSDRRRKVVFAVTGNAYGSSIVSPDHRKFPTIEFETTTIDEVIKNESLIPPTLIKIDVEDEEGNVFLGATETLNKFHPTIICEIHSSKSGRVVCPILEDYGYSCRVLGEPDYDWHIIERLDEGVEKRILAIHPDRKMS